MGNYDEPEKACNWMLKLRPGNIPALTRAAYLREIFGDVEGAITAMRMAYDATGYTETEDRAWILTQIAHLKLTLGKTGEAEPILLQALALFPGYHYALGNLAQVKRAQGKYAEAASLLEQRYEAAPHAENLYDPAEALALAGRVEAAERAFLEFEAKALAESAAWDNANQELIAYYAGRGHQPTTALEIAGRELARRRDIHTRDAYAWALHVNGRDAEARPEIQAALAAGTRDPKILAHAREIGIEPAGK